MRKCESKISYARRLMSAALPSNHNAPAVCQGLPQPNLRQTSNGIVILRERLSWLRQSNFVSLGARRRSSGCERRLAANRCSSSSALEIRRLVLQEFHLLMKQSAHPSLRFMTHRVSAMASDHAGIGHDRVIAISWRSTLLREDTIRVRSRADLDGRTQALKRLQLLSGASSLP